MEKMRSRFPVFSDPPRPLKIGIFDDAFTALNRRLVVIEAGCRRAYLSGLWQFTPRGAALSEALKSWTSRREYLELLVEGAPRFDLKGNPCGIVTPQQAEYARELLQRRGAA
ncbi:ProQ/FINO family protein [Bradyrhizobium sp. HKCCYLRH1065]|uniref:ProQ/FINO family protein n=1 Tax=Bradyrhizobium sp. HKCCYLRH1065 TaxID=3420753 RepID=UPI003EBB5AAF